MTSADAGAGVFERRTDRLRLRRWTAADVEPFAAVNADPEVMRHLGGVLTRAETVAMVDRMEAHWEEHGFGLWATELLDTGELIGFVGLAVPLFLPEVLPAVEVGWRLGRGHWGAGLATEAARESLRYGFGELGLDRIVSVYTPANVASGRVMAKLGMVPERDTHHPGSGVPLRVCAIDRDDWLSKTADARVAARS